MLIFLIRHTISTRVQIPVTRFCWKHSQAFIVFTCTCVFGITYCKSIIIVMHLAVYLFIELNICLNWPTQMKVCSPHWVLKSGYSSLTFWGENLARHSTEKWFWKWKTSIIFVTFNQILSKGGSNGNGCWATLSLQMLHMLSHASITSFSHCEVTFERDQPLNYDELNFKGRFRPVNLNMSVCAYNNVIVCAIILTSNKNT